MTDLNQEQDHQQIWKAFLWTVSSRRAVRAYTREPVPAEVIEKGLSAALLAPSASNLQPWNFYWVRSPEKKALLRKFCLGQPASESASELIVCVARTGLWKIRRRWFLDFYAKLGIDLPKPFDIYYSKIVPATYMIGPFGLLGLLKRGIFALVRIFRPMSAASYSQKDLILSAVKGTALASQNLMLAIRAQGYDSCPLEGFDPVRVTRLLRLPKDSKIVMVLAIGRRAVDDVKYGPPVRCDRNEMIFEV